MSRDIRKFITERGDGIFMVQLATSEFDLWEWRPIW